MLRVPLALALLLVASANGSFMFPRNGCGCIRNPVAAQLKPEEIAHLRGYIQQRGVHHYKAFTDRALQAIFRFNLLNNFPDVVPSSRAGVLQVVSESLNELTDKVVPSVSQAGEITGYLNGAVPELAGGGVNIDLDSLVVAVSTILHQRGVALPLDRLNILLKTGLSGYLQSPAYHTNYGRLSQLVATLDHIDHNLPNILDQDLLIDVRRKLETRFNLDSKIFDKRYHQAIKAFEANRARLMESFNSLAFRGPDYEVTIQTVIREVIRLFPGVSAGTLRSVLNILQLTNTGGGRATPKDLLAMITIPHLDSSIRSITDAVANRIYLKLPQHHQGLNRQHVHEAYALFIIGLASQGVQPLKLQAAHEAFVWHTQRFFLGTRTYTVEAYILYVIRVVVPSIPRGSSAFRLHLFDSSVVINNVLVPEPLKSIYKEGRQTIIARIQGLQGSSADITRRLVRGEGEKAVVENIVDLRPPIKNGPLPTYSKFEYDGVVLSATQQRAIFLELQRRFNRLRQPQLQLPLLRVLIRARVVRRNPAETFQRLFRGLPSFQAPRNIDGLITQLGQNRLTLTREQLLAGLQQFYVASRSLGIVIPPRSLPGVFIYTIRQYLRTLTTIPAQPFDFRFLQYVQERLASIIQRTVLINRSVPVVGRQVENIFNVFGNIQVSLRAQRTILRFISSSGLVRSPVTSSSTAITVYRRLLASLVQRYPVSTFILSVRELIVLRAQLSQVGIRVSLQYLRDANVMAFVGLGLFNRLQPTVTTVQFRQMIFVSIRTFARINQVNNIPSGAFFRIVFSTHGKTIPSLPVPHYPVIQAPVSPPIYILRGLTLPVRQVHEIVSALRSRFPFVSLDNAQAIIAHTVLLLRSRNSNFNYARAHPALMRYYSGLPRSLAISGVNIDTLLRTIDERLVDATISGAGIRSGLVELYLHMHFLGLPIPTPAVRDQFFSFILSAYGQMQVRRQLPFGRYFFTFLNSFLGKLPGYVKPFPLFAAPKIYDAFSSQLGVRISPADMPLLLQAIQRVAPAQGGQFNLGYLLQTIQRARPSPFSAPLTSSELTSLLGYFKTHQVAVSQPQLIRAFAICQLTVRLSVQSITRAQVLQAFQRVIMSTMRQNHGLFGAGLVNQLVSNFRQGKTIRRPYYKHGFPKRISIFH
nr:adult cement protein 2 [Chelonibia testudinaria]